MVDNCANPKCNKPLHYLRDGRVFTFNVPGASVGANGQRIPHIEHYWLCGDCAASMTLERIPESGVKVFARQMPGGLKPAESVARAFLSA